MKPSDFFDIPDEPSRVVFGKVPGGAGDVMTIGEMVTHKARLDDDGVVRWHPLDIDPAASDRWIRSLET